LQPGAHRACQRRLFTSLAHDPEAPGLPVVGRGRTAGGLDEACQDRGRNRIRQEAADGLPLQDRRERPVESALGLI